jgi:hypothetical protein
MEWCQLYRTQGVPGLKDKRHGGTRAKLTPAQRQDLKAKVAQYTPAQLFGAQAVTPDGQCGVRIESSATGQGLQVPFASEDRGV